MSCCNPVKMNKESNLCNRIYTSIHIHIMSCCNFVNMDKLPNLYNHLYISIYIYTHSYFKHIFHRKVNQSGSIYLLIKFAAKSNKDYLIYTL